MRRIHINVGVGELEEGIKFYNVLFGAEPTKTKPDYAKGMLEDPRLNFAVFGRAGSEGVDHLGLHVE